MVLGHDLPNLFRCDVLGPETGYCWEVGQRDFEILNFSFCILKIL